MISNSYKNMRDELKNICKLNPMTKSVELYILYLQQTFLYEFIDNDASSDDYIEYVRDPFIYLSIKLSNNTAIRNNYKILELEKHFQVYYDEENIYEFLSNIQVPEFLNISKEEGIPLLNTAIIKAHKDWSIILYMNNSIDFSDLFFSCLAKLTESDINYILNNSIMYGLPKFPQKFSEKEYDKWLDDKDNYPLSDNTVVALICKLMNNNVIAENFWLFTEATLKKYRHIHDKTLEGFYNTFIGIIKEYAKNNNLPEIKNSDKLRDACIYMWFNYNISGVLTDLYLKLEWCINLDRFFEYNLRQRIELVEESIKILPFL